MLLLGAFSALCICQLASATGQPQVPHLSPKGTFTCLYENKTYPAGARFVPEPCLHCHCPHHGGRARCAIKDCLPHTACLKYHREPGECCGQCLLQGCEHSDGKLYYPGTLVEQSDCEVCRCPESGGKTVCSHQPCFNIACVDPVQDPGDCCPRCPNGRNCWLGRQILPAGEEVYVTRCKRCMCPEDTRLKGQHLHAVCSLEPCAWDN